MSEAKTSKPAIIVLDQRATFADAKKIAGEHKGRLPTLQEFIRVLKDPEQFGKLSGDWYWTGEEQSPIKPEGYCKIDYDQFSLVEIAKNEWDALPKDQKAYMLAGKGAVEISLGEFWFGGKLYGGPVTAGPANGARVAYVALGGEAAPKPQPK